MEEISISDAVKEEQDYIASQLIRYNNARVAFTQEPAFLPVNRCIKNGREVIGGILAQVYCWNILYIDVLWVKEESRNKGYASRLVRDVESRAKEMNCRLAHLDTFDFQAKGLYEKLGYRVFGVLEDCPEGHTRYYMSKRLG